MRGLTRVGKGRNGPDAQNWARLQGLAFYWARGVSAGLAFSATAARSRHTRTGGLTQESRRSTWVDTGHLQTCKQTDPRKASESERLSLQPKAGRLSLYIY